MPTAGLWIKGFGVHTQVPNPIYMDFLSPLGSRHSLRVQIPRILKSDGFEHRCDRSSRSNGNIYIIFLACQKLFQRFLVPKHNEWIELLSIVGQPSSWLKSSRNCSHFLLFPLVIVSVESRLNSALILIFFFFW